MSVSTSGHGIGATDTERLLLTSIRIALWYYCPVGSSALWLHGLKKPGDTGCFTRSWRYLCFSRSRWCTAGNTGVPVLLPGNKKTKTGRLWTYVRDDRNAGSELAPAVWFAYSPDRKGIHPQSHLAGFSGVLQADAYAGFNELYRNGQITEAACWAHARRKIHDVHVRTPSALTEEALKRIGELYAIEAEIRGMPAK